MNNSAGSLRLEARGEELLKLKLQASNFMQRDRELFEEFDLSQKTQPIFFFYTWDKPAITLGKAQRGRDELMAEATKLGVDYFMRPTGGKAVLHGGDICYTFIGVQSDPVYGGKLRESFKAVNEMVIGMVNEILKLEVRGWTLDDEKSFTSSVQRLTSNSNCFSHTVCNEGIYADHKIVGAAQAMGKRAFIQQGSIQLNKPCFSLEGMGYHTTLSEITGEQYDLQNIYKALSVTTRI